MSGKAQKQGRPKKGKKPIAAPAAQVRPRREHVQGDWVETYESIAQANRPADFTFKKLRTLEKCYPENASTGRLGLLPAGPEMRLLTRGLWLNNNKLKSVANLPELAYSVLEFPKLLGLLDLSCNLIEDLHDDIFSFPNISVLYLHGNRINDPACIFKMRRLKKLHHLTLYGNPICLRYELGHIRNMVTWYLPNLQKLDNNRFTKRERNTPLTAKALKIFRSLGGDEGDWLFRKFPKPKLTPKQLQKCGLAPTDGAADDQDGQEEQDEGDTRMQRVAEGMNNA